MQCFDLSLACFFLDCPSIRGLVSEKGSYLRPTEYHHVGGECLHVSLDIVQVNSVHVQVYIHGVHLLVYGVCE